MGSLPTSHTYRPEPHAHEIGTGPHLPEPDQRVCDTVLTRPRLHPDRTAVICGDDTVSYRELAAMALDVSRRLNADQTYASSRRIGIQAYRTAGAPAYPLGVALSGRSFVFLNPESPESAVRHIRSSAGVSVVADPRSGELRELSGGGADVGPAATRPSPEDEAYVLYTSGSSGKPKGVSVSQRNLANSNAARLAVYEGFGTPTFLLLSPFYFDSSVAGVWGTLAAGGTLVIAREDERRDPAALVGLIARHRVTHTLTVPSFYAELLHTARQNERLVADLASLRLVICAGESLAQGVIEQHFSLLPDVTLGNEYGPTECTVWATYRLYEKADGSSIGFPIPGTSIHLLDDRLREVPMGEVGQIAISGSGVTQGYVGAERETQVRFVDIELAPGRTVKVYLTGDLGRWSAVNGLEFAGRLDNEVKIRGVRVNIEAIEESLVAHPDVQAAAVAHDGDTSTCYAFVVKVAGARLDAASVRRQAAAALGAAVVPDRVVFVDTLPRTAHDKIDRSALLASVRPAAPTPAAEPADAAQAVADDALATQITRAWEEVLGVSVNGAEASTFFELGGNSLTVLRLSRALGRIAGRPVAVKQVYRCGTIPQQVELLSSL
ncbi:non-ribosomal peptide synthetase [Streptantibioticus ferralitis]|uniref:Non-ribosomal peptide synthetase n=1 Tax=Streptantibioticus ferralitis TaxID=236510 RepID=A0ABT5YYF6_9ACTN|nr:non-ribosomal peptide synthetase [Streptantibioticus ferralitis]MDF2256589.1 non-ribosomal peptide synthetase [Streptantibioticus ferralitis]